MGQGLGLDGRPVLEGVVEGVADHADAPTDEGGGEPVDLGEGVLAGHQQAKEIDRVGEGREVGFVDGPQGGGDAVVEQAAAPTLFPDVAQRDQLEAGDVKGDGARARTDSPGT